jgi:hypothetical protein
VDPEIRAARGKQMFRWVPIVDRHVEDVNLPLRKEDRREVQLHLRVDGARREDVSALGVRWVQARITGTGCHAGPRGAADDVLVQPIAL